MEVQLKKMVSFALVVKHRSFTGAAQELGVPRSTVSQHISTLEDHLGVKLLFRSTRQLSLTSAGEIYFQHCEKMLKAAYDANLALSEWKEKPTGKLTLTAPEASGTTVHGKLISQFQQRYPGIEIEMVITDQKLDLVANGIDIAFRIGKLTDSNLICRQIAIVERVIVASPQYLSQVERPTLDNLQEQHCLVHKPLPKWPILTAEGVKNVLVPTTLRSNSLLFVREACVNHRGLALLPKMMCTKDLKEGALVVVGGIKVPDNSYHMIYQNRDQQPKALRCFIDFINESSIF